LAIGIMGRFCLWETFHFLLHGQLSKACRRWSAGKASSFIGLPIHYPSIQQLASAFQPHFRLLDWSGIGLFVPPSYIELPGKVIDGFARIDSLVSHWPLLRALSDHRCLVFVRI
jgi:hypothetical protein